MFSAPVALWQSQPWPKCGWRPREGTQFVGKLEPVEVLDIGKNRYYSIPTPEVFQKVRLLFIFMEGTTHFIICLLHHLCSVPSQFFLFIIMICIMLMLWFPFSLLVLHQSTHVNHPSWWKKTAPKNSRCMSIVLPNCCLFISKSFLSRPNRLCRANKKSQTFSRRGTIAMFILLVWGFYPKRKVVRTSLLIQNFCMKNAPSLIILSGLETFRNQKNHTKKKATLANSNRSRVPSEEKKTCSSNAQQPPPWKTSKDSSTTMTWLSFRWMTCIISEEKRRVVSRTTCFWNSRYQWHADIPRQCTTSNMDGWNKKEKHVWE